MAQKDGRALPKDMALPLMGNRRDIDTFVIPCLARGELLDPSIPTLREASGGVYEVWRPLEIPVKYPVISRKTRKPELREKTWTAVPGSVLRPKFRDATKAERLCLGPDPEFELDYSFVYTGKVSVLILTHHDDLESIWRLLARHLPANYIGMDLVVQGKRIVTCGKIEVIEDALARVKALRRTIQSKLEIDDPDSSDQAREMAAELALGLKGTTLPLINAREALELAAEAGNDAGVITSLFDAQGALNAAQMHTGVILMKTLDQTTRLLRMIRKVQYGYDHAYIALGELYQEVVELEKRLLRGETQGVPTACQRLATKALTIEARFIRVAPYDPWREALYNQRGRGLARAIINLRNGDVTTAKHNLVLALMARAKMVQGTGPGLGEITRIKTRIRQAVPEADQALALELQ